MYVYMYIYTYIYIHTHTQTQKQTQPQPQSQPQPQPASQPAKETVVPAGASVSRRTVAEGTIFSPAAPTTATTAARLSYLPSYAYVSRAMHT